MSLMTTVWISVHLGTSLDMWTLISGPKVIENWDFGSKMAAQVGIGVKWCYSQKQTY